MPTHALPRGNGDDGLVPSARIRRPLRVAILALSAALAALLGVVLWYFAIYRPAASAERDRQFRDVVCSLANPAHPREAAIRTRYHCADLPAGGRPSSSASPSASGSALPSSSSTSTSRATTRAGVTRAGATAAPHAPAQTHGAQPAPARTTTPPKRQAASQGRASSPAPAPHSTTSARPKLLAPVLDPVCGLVSGLGLPLC